MGLLEFGRIVLVVWACRPFYTRAFQSQHDFCNAPALKFDRQQYLQRLFNVQRNRRPWSSFCLCQGHKLENDCNESTAGIFQQEQGRRQVLSTALGTASGLVSVSFPAIAKPLTPEPTDEFTVTFVRSDFPSNQAASLGLELKQAEFRTNLRVYVKSIQPNSVAARKLEGLLRPENEEDFDKPKNLLVVVRVNDQNAERTDLDGVKTYIRQALANKDSIDNDNDVVLSITFRNSAAFPSQLQSLQPDQTVSTTVAPAGDTTQRDPTSGRVKFGEKVTSQEEQRVSVTQLTPPTRPQMCNEDSGAKLDDLLEISYVGRIYEPDGGEGMVFDGSTVDVNGKAIPGRGGDVSLFFVLGKQPFGQFPPGWDVGLTGMCIGERRRLLIPPVLAYGSKGLPRRKIPPDATLQYDVTLLSINGMAL